MYRRCPAGEKRYIRTRNPGWINFLLLRQSAFCKGRQTIALSCMHSFHSNNRPSALFYRNPLEPKVIAASKK